MSYQLLVRPDVEADITQAEGWYEERQEGLGKEFTREVRIAIRQLPQNPLLYRLRHRRLGIRWFYTPRFPYRIIYRIEGQCIVVLALLHARQHDSRWRKRALES